MIVKMHFTGQLNDGGLLFQHRSLSCTPTHEKLVKIGILNAKYSRAWEKCLGYVSVYLCICRLTRLEVSNSSMTVLTSSSGSVTLR